MTEKPFVVVNRNGMKFLAETKTNYILPINSIEAMCILLNYAYVNKDIPKMEYYNWWKDEELQEYLNEEEMEVKE